ncbi:aldehyde-activating protein [Kaistia sp. 32K]|uniref:GFA family protein n=1 Tax=Kaistia sp. 32K TaxID=2795690 RepID=UPI001916B693|nr:GFA family protein [Kaistia sp. 32K]BCP54337.1 aldehyde-activating protein [Kaistia sp. 32K]
MAASETRGGGCHCGRVRFTVRGDFGTAMSCNCSICQKRGHWLAFVPAADFTLESGADDLTDYQFNRFRIHHLFCSHCGVGSFGRGVGPDGAEMVAVNVRCLDDMDLSTVTVTAFDGRSH